MNAKLSLLLVCDAIILIFISAYDVAAQERTTSGTGIVTPGVTTTISATTSAPSAEQPNDPLDAGRLLKELGISSATGTVSGPVGSGPGATEKPPIFDISGESNPPDSVTRDPSQKNIPTFSLDTPMTEPGVPQSLKDIGKTPALDLDRPQSESVAKPLDKNVSPAAPLDGGPALPTADETEAPGTEIAPTSVTPQEAEASTSGTPSSQTLQPNPPQGGQDMQVPLLDP